jgi:chromosome segregation ATPase
VHQNQILQNVVSYLDSALCSGDGDPIAKIDGVKEQVEAQDQNIARLTKKCKSLQRALAAAQKELEERTNAAQIEQERTQTAVGELEATVAQLKESVGKLKAENHEFTRNLNLEREAKAELDETIAENRDEAIASLNSENNRIRAQLHQDLETCQAADKTLNEEFAESEAQLAKLRKLVQSQRATTKQKEAEVDEDFGKLRKYRASC